MKYTDIEYLNVEPNDIYSNLTEKVINKCFETENLTDKNITISIIFTTPIDIQAYNKEYRNIDRATDVLSFPMFEKDEVEKLNSILREYSNRIIGRMGMPYSKKSINIITIVIDAPQDEINTLSGKIGKLSGITSKVIYSNK